MANENQEIKKVVDILSHGESKGMYVVTAILEGGIEDTRAHSLDTEMGKNFKAAAENFVATHPKKDNQGKHRMNLQFFGEYETRVKNAEKISKKKYTTGDLVLAASMGIAATGLTGLVLFNAYTGKTNEETTVAPETTIETTVETPVEPAEFDETKQTIKLTYDEATEVMTGFNNHINETLESNGFSRIDEKSEQALWILANNNNLKPETIQQFISEQRATADPRPMVENSFPTWDAISENNTKYGLGKVDNIIDISDYLVDADAQKLTKECVKMLEELRALGYNNAENPNLDADKATAERIYNTIATYLMLDEYKDDEKSVIGYLDEYESAGNVLLANQSYINSILGVLSDKKYITKAQSNAITGYHADPSTGEKTSNTRIFMVDEIMGEWRRNCTQYTETYGGLTAEEVEYIRQQYAAQEAPAEEKETTPATR